MKANVIREQMLRIIIEGRVALFYGAFLDVYGPF